MRNMYYFYTIVKKCHLLIKRKSEKDIDNIVSMKLI